LVVAKLILAQLDKSRIYHKRLDELGLGFAITFIGWIAAGVHLLLFDRLFLKHGKWVPAPIQRAPAFVPPGPHMPVVSPQPPIGVSGGVVPPTAQPADAQPRHPVP
jgi:hypothetical protein